MIPLVRCAGIAALLVSAGCGWLEPRQDSPPPAMAEQLPAETEKPAEPDMTDPFAPPMPGMDSAPKTKPPEAVRPLPQQPLDVPIGDPVEGVPVMGQPEVVWDTAPSGQACPCPKCRSARKSWWHRVWPCRDEDCDGFPQVPCERLVEAHERSMERVLPVGTFLNAAMETQIANGDVADMMIYDYDFLPGTAVLKLRGQREVRNLQHRWLATGSPLLIQTIPAQPQLDLARRAAVLAELERIGQPVPPEAVVISEPLTRGLDGLDAEIVHSRRLQQQAGGAPGAGVPATPEPTIGVPGGP